MTYAHHVTHTAREKASFELIMHAQVNSVKQIDLGHAPYWFSDLWQNANSRFLVDIDFDNPPEWLVQLHETSTDLSFIPEHLLLQFHEDLDDVAPVSDDPDATIRALLAKADAAPDATIGDLLNPESSTSPPVSAPPDAPCPSFMVPPVPTSSADSSAALLKITFATIMSSFPPEDPPFWFAHVWHDPECILCGLISNVKFPLWLEQLWGWSADNNSGFPLPEHLTKSAFATSAPAPAAASSSSVPVPPARSPSPFSPFTSTGQSASPFSFNAAPFSPMSTHMFDNGGIATPKANPFVSSPSTSPTYAQFVQQSFGPTPPPLTNFFDTFLDFLGSDPLDPIRAPRRLVCLS